MVTVEMMGEMSLDDWDEKSGNDQDEVEGMKQEVDSKGNTKANNSTDIIAQIDMTYSLNQ